MFHQCPICKLILIKKTQNLFPSQYQLMAMSSYMNPNMVVYPTQIFKPFRYLLFSVEVMLTVNIILCDFCLLLVEDLLLLNESLRCSKANTIFIFFIFNLWLEFTRSPFTSVAVFGSAPSISFSASVDLLLANNHWYPFSINTARQNRNLLTRDIVTLFILFVL